MTNQDVINFLNHVRKMLLDDKSWLESTTQPINEAFDMAISALQAQEIRDLLPVSPLLDKKKKKRKREKISAPQPQELSNNSPKLNSENGDLQPTCNNLATDCISRQAAINALVKAIRKDPYYDSNEAINGLGVCDVRVILNDLPSAQSEPLLDEIVDEIRKTIAETESNGKYHADPVRHNGEMICHGLQIALNIIEEKRNERSD